MLALNLSPLDLDLPLLKYKKRKRHKPKSVVIRNEKSKATDYFYSFQLLSALLWASCFRLRFDIARYAFNVEPLQKAETYRLSRTGIRLVPLIGFCDVSEMKMDRLCEVISLFQTFHVAKIAHPTIYIL